MRGASSADKLMVSHKAGHELLLLLLLPLTDKQTVRSSPSPCTLRHIYYAAIAVVARRSPATRCGSFFGRLQQLPASKLSGKVCWLANNNGDMRLQCATNEGKQERAARAAAAQTGRYTCSASRYPTLPPPVHNCGTQLPFATPLLGIRGLLPAAEDGTSWQCYLLQLEITQPQMR